MLEFKQENVSLITAGQSAAAVAKTLDAAIQTFFNQVTRVRQLRTQVLDLIDLEFETCPYNRLSCWD